jgi:hypothetical protein
MYQYKIEIKTHMEDENPSVFFLNAKDYRMDVDNRKGNTLEKYRSVLNLAKEITSEDNGEVLVKIYDTFAFMNDEVGEIRKQFTFSTILEETNEIIYSLNDCEVEDIRINVSAQEGGLDGNGDLSLVRRLSIEF